MGERDFFKKLESSEEDSLKEEEVELTPVEVMGGEAIRNELVGRKQELPPDWMSFPIEQRQDFLRRIREEQEDNEK